MDLDRMNRLTQGMKNVSAGETSMSEEEIKRIYSQSNDAYNAGDYARSFELTKQAANNGHVGAMADLGMFYRTGKGVGRDDAQAFSWYKKAAERGNSYAMFQVAQLYRNGEGVMQSNEDALNWHRQAADKGNFRSMICLGFMYAWGEGVKLNPKKAFEWLNRAIDQTKSDGDAADTAEAFRKLADLGRAFKKQLDEWEKMEIDIGPRVWADINKSYEYKINASHLRQGYWHCLKIAADNGNIEAQREYARETDSGCFITTAVCGSLGKPDDCYELSTFRAFRDGWLRAQSDGQSLIDEYYRIAPKIVAQINALPDQKEIYRSILKNYLNPCLELIEQGKSLECKNLYVRMVNTLRKSFLK